MGLRLSNQRPRNYWLIANSARPAIHTASRAYGLVTMSIDAIAQKVGRTTVNCGWQLFRLPSALRGRSAALASAGIRQPGGALEFAHRD